MYKMTNRDKKKKTKTGLMWCNTCDGSLVGIGSRCKRCGHIQTTKRLRPFKKQDSIQVIDDEITY